MLVTLWLSFSPHLPLSLDYVWIARFSELEPSASVEGWEPWTFKNVPLRTQYELALDQGRTVLRAESSQSASAILKKVEIEPTEFPVLVWSWKTLGLGEGADWNRKASDDFPLRLFVIFEEKQGLFGMFRSMAGRFNGTALNYVWSSDSSEASGPSSASSRVQMVSVRKGTSELGTWVVERRNVLNDYQRLFGKTPGRITGIAIMNDSDDTQGWAVSYFGDIRFEEELSSGHSKSSQ